MYQPPHFKSNDPAVAADIIRGQPFASLISNDDEGLPFVSHLPMHLDVAGDQFTLWAHCAKPNPHWRYLQARPEAVVTFMGPHAYLSPKVYPDLARVPSWNYVAVHCKVRARLVEEPAAKDALLKKLIGDFEPPFAQQWIDQGEEFQNKMLAGIVGFELTVLDWQCKLKINQHRKESHAALRTVYAAGNEDERALGVWMDRLGLKG
jgi:transcriptional regulator